MRLSSALRVEPGRVVAFVGAGGKSSAIRRLTAELGQEARVLISTTTKLSLSQERLAKTHLVVHGLEDMAHVLESLAIHGSVLVTGGLSPGEPKFIGPDMALLSQICEKVKAVQAVALIEADGARGRSIKAPAKHEPQMPPFADLVVPVVGMDIMGKNLDDSHAHRPELVGDLTRLEKGSPIEAGHLVDLLISPSGALKGIPPGAEVRILLNKIESERSLGQGRQIARQVLASGRVQAIVLAAVKSKSPAKEVMGRVAGIVLAAGASTRLGQPKQLIPWRGKPLVWHAIQAAYQGGCSPVVVVLGARGRSVREALAEVEVRLVQNQAWSEGISSSLGAGLKACQKESEAAVFLLADMPFVGGELVRALIATHRRSLAPIVATCAEGRNISPALFDRSTFASLGDLEGDIGGRQLFESYPVTSVDWDPGVGFDIDTPEDLAQWEGFQCSGR